MNVIQYLVNLLHDPLGAINGWIVTFGAIWVYAPLFLVIFVETGVVVMPFLPGDSLLFAAGCVAASGEGLQLLPLLAVVWCAAILGDQSNFAIGHFFGRRIIASGKVRSMTPERIEKSQAFLDKWGPLAVFLGRFFPFIRTFVPFLSGMGGMHWRHFVIWNVLGGITWSSLFTLLGYFFGNIPFVQAHFELILVAIVLVSAIPAAAGAVKAWLGRKGKGAAGKGGPEEPEPGRAAATQADARAEVPAWADEDNPLKTFESCAVPETLGEDGERGPEPAEDASEGEGAAVAEAGAAQAPAEVASVEGAASDAQAPDEGVAHAEETARPAEKGGVPEEVVPDEPASSPSAPAEEAARPVEEEAARPDEGAAPDERVVPDEGVAPEELASGPTMPEEPAPGPSAPDGSVGTCGAAGSGEPDDDGAAGGLADAAGDEGAASDAGTGEAGDSEDDEDDVPFVGAHAAPATPGDPASFEEHDEAADVPRGKHFARQ